MLTPISPAGIIDGSGGAQAAESAALEMLPVREAPSTDFTYDLSKDDDGKSVVIKEYTGDGGDLVIPAEIEGLPVSTLYDQAFSAGGYGEGPGANITS